MILSSLDKKLLRDLLAIRSQVFAIVLVIGAGIATFVMSLCALKSLEQTQQAYYEKYRFAQVFGRLKRAPDTLKPRIEEIPGVARVQTRIVFDVTIDVAKPARIVRDAGQQRFISAMIEPATGRLISVPETGEPELNGVHLRRGRWLEPGREGEVLVSELFAEAHQLHPNDTVSAIINGRKQILTIVGIVLSPEYVIQIGAGSMLPDDRRFGVFWMGRRQLEAAFDMEGAFNDVSLTMMRGASEPEIIRQLDNLLEPYGSIGADGRSIHVSHQYLSDELRQLRAMAIIAPVIFLGVAAFLLNVVITRLISTQREQIAALKAFGYTKWQVGLHYVKLVLVIAVLGVLLGTVAGGWMGSAMTRMYAQFYRFPIIHFQFDYGAVVIASAITCGAAILGTLSSLSRAIRLPPAEAMRPEPPASFRPTVIERLGLARMFPQIFRMILRNMERRPIKTLMSSAGISMAVAVLILGSFSLDAIMYIMDFQFRKAQRQDMQITFVEPLEPGALHEIQHLPGVLKTEAFRAVATKFSSAQHSRRVGIMGLPQKTELFRLLDVDEQVVDVPEDGLMLSDKLASLLHVGVGDTVSVQVLEGERPRREIPVAAIITEYNGANAYMNQRALNRILHEDALMSGAFLAVDSQRSAQLYQQLKLTPSVAGVTIKSSALESFEKTVAENLLTMRMFNIGFSVVIAFGVVYNSARVSLAEQSREMATLRVIGFTRSEVSTILLGELAILTVFAIPFGWLMGYGFAAIATLGLDTELYRIPLKVNQTTFVYAAITVVIAAFLSGLVVRRRVDQLDLVAVLKTKE